MFGKKNISARKTIIHTYSEYLPYGIQCHILGIDLFGLYGIILAIHLPVCIPQLNIWTKYTISLNKSQTVQCKTPLKQFLCKH